MPFPDFVSGKEPLSDSDIQLSKLLSYVLRHKPDEIGLVLDKNGWAKIASLVEALGAHGHAVAEADVRRVFAGSKKQRFAISDDGRCVRANHGHSVDVDLQLENRSPPELLYHGTAKRHLPSIRRLGLIKGRRQHVHLSVDVDSARSVGARHGTPVVLGVRAAEMSRRGFEFFVSESDVWLTDRVPREFLEALE